MIASYRVRVSVLSKSRETRIRPNVQCVLSGFTRTRVCVLHQGKGL